MLVYFAGFDKNNLYIMCFKSYCWALKLYFDRKEIIRKKLRKYLTILIKELFQAIQIHSFSKKISIFNRVILKIKGDFPFQENPPFGWPMWMKLNTF